MESCDFHYHSSVKKQDVLSHPFPLPHGGAVMRYSSPSQPSWLQWRSVGILNTYPHPAVIIDSCLLHPSSAGCQHKPHGKTKILFPPSSNEGMSCSTQGSSVRRGLLKCKTNKIQSLSTNTK